MTTQQAMEALHALPRMGQGAPGLARMQNLCDHLGNPEKELQCIHIAGTNGKGSLAAMTSSILAAAGYKTGLTISPYVVDFRERFQIDGEMIPPRTLANLTEKVLDAIDAIEAEGGEKPVEFEAVTALAFLWFAREKCDLVVLETGLGGRCDATNVVPHKLVAAITKIGYDHMEVLGDTLDKIAAEKAGIIKEGTVVVNYPDQPAEAMGPILTAAAEAHTSIITPDKDDLTLLRGKRLENRIDYGGYRAALGLPGTHQANHAAMAVEIALALWREFGYDISDDAILQGLADARMPARIEVLRRHPLLLLDGCHNPDGAKMLAATLTRADFEENLVGVLGVLADKDYKDMLSDLAPCFAKIYTVTPNCPRALSAEELQKEARFHTDAEAADSVADAIRKAVDYADENNLAGVVVCGSLYLAAEARPLLLKEAEK
ncbi:bifunctional folylpolyglutamate synthase/dihydrofolate synthase [Gemmiger formicilis]|uniref:bifunctional folylpolyglutamate synthase/dihydrofolate synthase n=1 Tax=Gemmiger formicilis TaxID=745368 RepID=UPI0020980D4D|nr:bifunctional folylpolyglutamate synthase/dihydrofolate synthase [Gemmiger formicilis]